MKEEKNHVGRPTNEEVKTRKNKKVHKTILSIIIGILLLFVVICVGIIIYVNSITVKLNEVAKIEKDGIKITVLGSEKTSINKELSIANGEYVKVKLTIENYSENIYNWSYNFSLGDEMPALNTLGESDVLKTEINPGEKVTGYLYFPVSNSNILEYTTNMSVSNDSSVSVEKIRFKLK